MTMPTKQEASRSVQKSIARNLISKLPFAKLSRFGTIGALNTATYAILSSGLIGLLGVEATLSSAIAFAGCLPLAFWSHKLITFRSDKRGRDEFLRFTLVQVLSFAVATLTMFVCVHLLGLHHLVPILVTILIVPLISFIVMERWVFNTKPKSL